MQRTFGGEMSQSDQATEQSYTVVVNHEQQYSIWPAGLANAPGWQDAGMSGSRDECLAFIEQVWTDMRPLSLRQQMEADGRGA
jgi:MbtH protein